VSKKWIYNLTIFVSAFLLFQVQPMIAKMVLPWFGGAASVWITCMLFFQLVLLAGYMYAHWSINYLKPKIQIFTHILLVAASLLLLPVSPDRNLVIANNFGPMVQLLLLLLASVGIPYFLLSTTSPLLQSWYSRSFNQAMPYRLFALSNLSSLLGLLAYPFLIEPNLTLSQQSGAWSAGYALFAGACVITAAGALRAGKAEVATRAISDMPDENEPAPPTIMEKGLWLLLATCASAMLLSTTNYLTQNVASIPFLWIMPLSLYLFSFTLCFDRNGWYHREWYVWIIGGVLATMAFFLVHWGHNYKMIVTIPFFCAALFACCMFCHGELAIRKPAPKYLTSFYLMLSVGGALGGVLISIVVPNTLTGPFELAITMNGCALLLMIVNFRKKLITDVVCAGVLLGVLIASGYYIRSLTEGSHLLARNFYGCLKINIYDPGDEDERRTLINGTITHGVQFTDIERRDLPISYYSPDSGVGLAIKSLGRGPRRVGIIGLGVGSLSAYARPGDTYHYYEIDPLVKQLAQTEFSYVSDCRGKLQISIGDGRLLLEQEPEQNYDLLIVDAFSSDSIPVHLLTVEAIKLYFHQLKPDGILALHITNRHLDLAPVVESERELLGKKAVLVSYDGDHDNEIYTSDWVLMTSKRDLMKLPYIRKVATLLKSRPDVHAWRDDYSNLIQVVKGL
jgi:hypothetical protein